MKNNNKIGIIWLIAGNLMLFSGFLWLQGPNPSLSILYFLAAGLDFLNAYIYLSKTNESN